MSRKMLVDAVHLEETRVVITDNKSTILEYDFTTTAKPQIKGNVYLAKVTRVEPSLQAAFVEYGGGKQGFLPFSEIHPNYYQIPTSDREKLMKEEADEAALDAEDEDDFDDHENEQIEEDPVTNTLAERASENKSVKSAPIEASENGEADDSLDEKPKRGRSRRRGRKPANQTEPTETQSEPDDSDASDSADTSAADQGAGDDSSNEDESNHSNRRRRGGRYRNRKTGRSAGQKPASQSETSEVEVLSGEDEIERPRRKREYTRRYKIQEVIKRNQVLLVQVIKEERGNKGVSLTSFLSLAGRYCVLMPNSPRGGGVSRKIASNDDRKRLKKVLSDLALPTGMSVIIRTAGSGHTRTEIKRDFDYLVKLWNQIREDTLASSAPALVYEESNIIQRCIRDSYNMDIEEIMVDGEQAFKDTKAFMKRLIPSHAPRVKLYKGDVPLYHSEGIDSQLVSMTEPEVRLPSGGSIVMSPTEALISIDVNSGRSTRERNVEETALKTNIEAAKEVARQLRLRDLAGLIVIDFIDMNEGKNRRTIERTMKEALRHDKAKIQVGRISSFGLMEMSRQRMRPSIAESINRSCPHCQGTGTIRSEAALSMQIIRALEKEASTPEYDRFRVSVTASEAVYILNNMRSEIDKIEKNSDCVVEILIDSSLHEGDYRIEKLRRKGAAAPASSERTTSPAAKETETQNDNNRNSNSRRRGGRNRNRKPRDETQENASNQADTDTSSNKTNSGKTDRPASTPKPRVQTPTADKSVDDNSKGSVVEEKPKRSLRGRRKPTAKAAETPQADAPKASTHEAKAPVAPDTVVVETEAKSAPKATKPTKPKKTAKKIDDSDKPKRSGWWQKIVD